MVLGFGPDGGGGARSSADDGCPRNAGCGTPMVGCVVGAAAFNGTHT